MPLADLPIFGSYEKQRFLQFNPEDCANWYVVANRTGKRKMALYPVLGRQHVRFLNRNRLIYLSQPRAEYRSKKYAYIFVSDRVLRYDTNFNEVDITPPDYNTVGGPIYFDYLETPGFTLAAFTDGIHIYVHCEENTNTITVTDSNAPSNPTAIKAFGNRFVVATVNSTQMVLSQINLGGVTSPAINVNPATCFTVSGSAVFAQEVGFIVGFAVLNNTLYVFTPFTTGVWSNTASQVTNIVAGTPVVSTFPWRKNTTYDFNYGLADFDSLDVSFGLMVWMGQSENGLVQIVSSSGQAPKPISTEAIDILLQRDAVSDLPSPFLNGGAEGFLYQYEGTILYRLSAGRYNDFGVLDVQNSANSIEYNFKCEEWHRLIEKNGDRCRVQKHMYFANRHLVTVEGDGAIYELANFYTNEVRNPQAENPQADDAFIKEPFRYERVTPIIAEDDQAEFTTSWVQIDFVWGVKTFINSLSPYENAVYIVDEDGTPLVTENGEFIVTEDSNYPQQYEKIYHEFFKPHVELYFSDDGGVTFLSADVREFSQLGVYQWRMRWYQLGTSRNRVYKLVCVSPAPIVILGGVMMKDRVSDGAS